MDKADDQQHRHDLQDVHRRAPAAAEPGRHELLRRRPAPAGPEGQPVEHPDRDRPARPGPARPGLRDSATRHVHPQPQRQAVAGPRLAGGRAGRGRPCPALPADAPGEAADREGGPGLGGGPAPGQPNCWGTRGSPCSTKPPRSCGRPRPKADRPVFFSDDTCIYNKRGRHEPRRTPDRAALPREQPRRHRRAAEAARCGLAASTVPRLRGRRRRPGRDQPPGPGRPAGRHPACLPARQDAPQLRLPDEPGADPQPGPFGRQPRIPPHRRSRQRGRPQGRGGPGASRACGR